jgi:Bacterial TSP3 repeat
VSSQDLNPNALPEKVKTMNRNYLITALLAALLFGWGFAQDTDTDKDGLPDAAEVLLGTNPQNADTDGDGVNDLEDQTPNKVDTIPQASTGEAGLSIAEVLVENNYDAVAKKDAADHLEISLTNSGQQAIGELSVYYTIKDLVTMAEQSYLLPLTDFVIAAGETKVVHIDASGEAGHYSANPNSLYYTSQNEMQVDVTVSAKGYQAATGGIKKDAGGPEEAD